VSGRRAGHSRTRRGVHPINNNIEIDLMDQPFRPGDIVAIRATVDQQSFRDPARLFVTAGFHQHLYVSPDDIVTTVRRHFKVGEIVRVNASILVGGGVREAEVVCAFNDWLVLSIGDDHPPLVVMQEEVQRIPVPEPDEVVPMPVPALAPEPDALPVEDAVAPAPEGVQF